MAKIGLNNFRYSILTEAEDGTPTYNGAKKPARAISCSVEVESNEAELYADDVLAESDTSFNKGTVTVGIDEDDDQTLAELLGHEYQEESGIVRNADDAAPYVGFGRVITKLVNGKRKYKVEFIYKAKFAEPAQEDNTKGESLEFATTEIEGTISALASGVWSAARTFDAKADAVAWLESLMAVSD